MILGHIGARKGSKGVVGKNFRPIAGKPLIDWSLDQLFRNKNVDAMSLFQQTIPRFTNMG